MAPSVCTGRPWKEELGFVFRTGVLFMGLSFAQLAVGKEPSRALSLGLGTSSELALVNTIIDGEEKSFSLASPMGLSVDLRMGGLSDHVSGFVQYNGHMPGSLSRLVTQTFSVGAVFMLRRPAQSAPSLGALLSSFHSQRWFPYLSAALLYESLFYVTFDKDEQTVILDRGASGLSLGGGIEWAPAFLNESKGDWIPSHSRLRTLGLAGGLGYLFLSSDEFSTGLQSFFFQVRFRQSLN